MRYIGVSNFNVEQMKRALKIAPITSLQPPYSLVNPEVEKEILPFCKANNIGVINYSPMASGLLTGKMTAERIASMPDDDWRRRAPQFREPQAFAQLETGGVAARDWQRTQGATRSGGDCLDVAQPGSDRGNCGRAQSGSSGRNSARGNFPVERRGSGENRCVYEGEPGVVFATGATYTTSKEQPNGCSLWCVRIFVRRPRPLSLPASSTSLERER